MELQYDDCRTANAASARIELDWYRRQALISGRDMVSMALKSQQPPRSSFPRVILRAWR